MKVSPPANQLHHDIVCTCACSLAPTAFAQAAADKPVVIDSRAALEAQIVSAVATHDAARASFDAQVAALRSELADVGDDGAALEAQLASARETHDAERASFEAQVVETHDAARASFEAHVARVHATLDDVEDDGAALEAQLASAVATHEAARASFGAQVAALRSELADVDDDDGDDEWAGMTSTGES